MSDAIVNAAASFRPPDGTESQGALGAGTVVPITVSPVPGGRGSWITIVCDTAFNVMFGASATAADPANIGFFPAGIPLSFDLDDKRTNFKLRAPVAGNYKWWASSY